LYYLYKCINNNLNIQGKKRGYLIVPQLITIKTMD
jgi:hypothetical protein